MLRLRSGFLAIVWTLGGTALLAQEPEVQPPLVVKQDDASADLPSGATVAADTQAAIEARLDNGFRQAMQLIYQGRRTEATRIAADMRRLAPSDPRPYLLQARILRLDVPDQNFERSDIKLNVGPIDAELEHAIAGAQRLLAADANSVPGLLYRGWARMFESQMRALTNDYWGAGRKAKAGKEDLDRVLRLEPRNPDARFVQGTYLYFADILPGLVKVAGFLVRVPGGDLERGIENVHYAAENDGYSRLDARSILGVIYFGFEGRFADARDQFAIVEAEFPHNPRILEPLAVMDLFEPSRLAGGLARTKAGVEASAASDEPGVRDVAERLRLYQALGEFLTGDLDGARASLETLRSAMPEQPDWLSTAAHLVLADLYLLSGDNNRTFNLQMDLSGNAAVAGRLRFVLEPDAASSPAQAARLRAIGPAVQRLYDGEIAPLEQVLAAYADVEEPDLEFYRGEMELLRGQPLRALTHFENLTRAPLANRWRLFRLFAFLRTAEIQGARGQDQTAAEVLDKALAFHSDPDLIRHVMKARRRFFDSGQPHTPPGTEGNLTRRSGEAGQ